MSRIAVDRLRQAGLAVAIAGAVALLIAWFVQYRLGIVPCELCLLERWPFRLLIVFGIASMVVPARAARGALIVCACLLVASILLAGLHVGVERHDWQSPFPSCRAPEVRGGSFADQLASMPLVPQKPCDAPTLLIPFIPISMAGLNALYSLALLLGVLAALLWNRRPTTPSVAP